MTKTSTGILAGLSAAAILAAAGCGGGHDAPTSLEASEHEADAADTDAGSGSGTAGDENELEEFEFENAAQDNGPEELRKAEAALLSKLAPRRKEIDERELETAKRAKELDSITEALDGRLASINALEKRLQEKLGVGEAARQRREERTARLADLVSTMRPQAGANMLANMVDEDAQGILLAISRDSDRKAAKILSLMPAERAAQLGQLYLDVQAPPAGSEDLGPTVNAQGPPAAPAEALEPADAPATEETGELHP